MQRTIVLALFVLAGAMTGGAGMIGCSGTTATSTAPSVHLTSPASGASVPISAAAATVPVTFTVTNFTLRDVGQCGVMPDCGHVQLFIDGATCNQPTRSFNNEDFHTSTTARLDACPGFPALSDSHTLRIELHADDESPVTGSDGGTAADQVSFKTIQPGTTVMVGPGGLTFEPGMLTVHAGDTVHWVWSSSGHNVVSGAGGVADNRFCSPNDSSCAGASTSSTGATYDHKLTAAGTFPYFCAPHFAAGMTGMVIVQ